MGKWAQYQKRGGSVTFGSLAPPAGVTVDWSIGVVTATTIPTTRIAAVPSGATQMIWRAINNATGAITVETNSLTGLTTLTTYRVAASWWNGAQRVSDYSVATLVTTT